MSLRSEIKFRAPRKLHKRAMRVVRALSNGQANSVTISDFGRMAFISEIEKHEERLGLTETGKAVQP